MLELNRNPENYFAEVEQAAFKPSAFVPGIGPSPDKMLQARLMSYADTHLHRLGANHHQVPVNQPRCPVHNYIRDGALATAANYGSQPNYWPNSLAGAPEPNAQYADPAWKLGWGLGSDEDVKYDPRRLLLAGVGVLAVAAGAVGVFVPGLPTTIFLIVASYCFARSCPWLEERLLRRPLFAPYLQALDRSRPMPRRARVAATAAMWISVGISLAALHAADRLAAWLAVTLLLALAAGTVAIGRTGRRSQHS